MRTVTLGATRLEVTAVQVAIVGARTPGHLTESLGALDLPLSSDDLVEIDHIMAAALPVGGPTPQGMA
jgi:aryl-alcohol dehydrogenase-like predicted oxidoreductase